MAKQQKTVSPFMRHIEDLYQMEIEDEYRNEAQRTVTFNFPVDDACMLAAIAKRFGKSTAAFGGELFAEHVRELFIALTPEDRNKLAADADAEAVAYLASKGITRTYAGAEARGHWSSYAAICDKVEREGKGNE